MIKSHLLYHLSYALPQPVLVRRAEPIGGPPGGQWTFRTAPAFLSRHRTLVFWRPETLPPPRSYLVKASTGRDVMTAILRLLAALAVAFSLSGTVRAADVSAADQQVFRTII